jgi:methylated-DNA-[protein]-cysteine S-methyltransferase
MTTAIATSVQTARIVTPIGPICLACSDIGVLAVRINADAAGFAASLRRRFDVEVDGADVRDLAQRIQDYFGGDPRPFDVAVDLRSVSPFGQRVLIELRRVPWGAVCTYGELARRIGRQHGARAVGGVMARNPVPIVIPCHRVVASAGLGGFTGGLAIKRALLTLEGRRDPDGPMSVTP